jgi:hypothetical protein
MEEYDIQLYYRRAKAWGLRSPTRDASCSLSLTDGSAPTAGGR